VNGLRAERAGNAVRLTWTANPEKDIRDYVVSWRDASGTERTLRSAQTRATLPALASGTVVGVRAVNTRGHDGWDRAKAIVP
jgi:hypothetical protein